MSDFQKLEPSHTLKAPRYAVLSILFGLSLCFLSLVSIFQMGFQQLPQFQRFSELRANMKVERNLDNCAPVNEVMEEAKEDKKSLESRLLIQTNKEEIRAMKVSMQDAAKIAEGEKLIVQKENHDLMKEVELAQQEKGALESRLLILIQTNKKEIGAMKVSMQDAAKIAEKVQKENYELMKEVEQAKQEKVSLESRLLVVLQGQNAGKEKATHERVSQYSVLVENDQERGSCENSNHANVLCRGSSAWSKEQHYVVLPENADISRFLIVWVKEIQKWLPLLLVSSLIILVVAVHRVWSSKKQELEQQGRSNPLEARPPLRFKYPKDIQWSDTDMAKTQYQKSELPPLPSHQRGPLMRSGSKDQEQGADKGWKKTRLANNKREREMRPASCFQRFESIVRSIPSGEVWEDPDRPGLPESADIIEWQRPECAGENYGAVCRLFKPPPGSTDPMDPNDFRQGCLCDCWFIAAASTVAMEDSLDQRWLGRYDENKGVYEFVFYDEIDFSERRVCVDRFLPLWRFKKPVQTGCLRGDRLPGDYRYHFCRSETPGELWPSLIEKAFAKLYGSYEKLSFGFTSIGIANLTRGVPYFFEYGKGLPSSAADLWSKMVRMWNNGYLMAISWKVEPIAGGGGPCGEPAAAFGLIAQHAYGILGLYKSASTGLRFVKIRNPHACNEWQGPWSDNSREVKDHPLVLGECDIEESKNDGVFLMCINDVVKHALHLEGIQCFQKVPPGRRIMVA